MAIHCQSLTCKIYRKVVRAVIGERISELRNRANLSQAELARKLSVTRSSVNAWESSLSAPTAVYLIELAKLFHVSTDYLLGVDEGRHIDLSGLSEEEIGILYSLLDYFDRHRKA